MKHLAIVLILALIIGLASVQASALSEADLAGEAADMLVGIRDPESRLEETSLGDAAADAALYISGTDIAIVNGGVFQANLSGGPVYYRDCLAVFSEDPALAVAEVTPTQLKTMLENGVSHAVVDREEYLDRDQSRFDGFPQIGGFSFQYDLSAPAGSRVIWIKMRGEDLDLSDASTAITLCAPEALLSGGYGYPAFHAESCGQTLSTALYYYVQNQGTLEVPRLERIRTRGSNDSLPFESLHIAPALLVIAIICFAAMGGYKFKKFYDFER